MSDVDTASFETVMVGERILAEATGLSVPRYPGTPGDLETIDGIEERLRLAGLETELQWFSYDLAPATFALRMVLVVGGLLVGSAGFVALRSPLAALLILIVGLFPGLVFLAWSSGLERMYQGGGPTRTANVIGRRPAGDPDLTVILMAHHDSKSQSLSFPYRMGLTLAALAAGLLLAVVLVAGVIRGQAPGPAWLTSLPGCAAGIAALILSTMRSGNLSPGGVDNAGSMAILLELARTLPEMIRERVELVFLSTGAEEDHMVGAMRWLDANSRALDDRPVFCLNFDGAGAPGRTVLIERFGLGRMFSRTMSAAARRAAARLRIPVRGILMLPGIGIDAIPFAHRGLDCLTLSSGSVGRATLSVHSANDHPHHLDAAPLGRIAALAQQTLVELVGDNRGGAPTSQ